MLSPLGPMHEAEPSINRADVASNRTAVALDWSHLEQHRIVAHNVTDPRAKTFRHAADASAAGDGSKKLAISGSYFPDGGLWKNCHRHQSRSEHCAAAGRSALLIDMDLQRPAVAKYLGIKCRQGLHGVLEGRTRMIDAVVRTHAELRVDGPACGGRDFALVRVTCFSGDGCDVAGY